MAYNAANLKRNSFIQAKAEQGHTQVQIFVIIKI